MLFCVRCIPHNNNNNMYTANKGRSYTYSVYNIHIGIYT